MLADQVKTRLESEVSDLAGRVEHALELAELVRREALPQARQAAFVVPGGLRPGGGESAAGAFTQDIDEVVTIVLVLQSAGDVTGAKAAPRLDALVWSVIGALAGWAPEDADGEIALYVGDFRLLRAQLVSLVSGAAIYQVEFAIALQLRIFS